MRLLLLVLLLAAHVAVFSDMADADIILTNNVDLMDENDPTRVMQKMVQSLVLSQEKIVSILTATDKTMSATDNTMSAMAKTMSAMAKTMNSLLTEIKELRIDVKTAKLDTSIRAKGSSCSPPFVKNESMCLLAECSPAQWSVARQTCVAKGGDLIYLESRSHHEKANVFFNKSCASASQYWTSLHRDQTGKLTWGDRGINNYTPASILNKNQKNFASDSSSVTLRGQTPITELASVCRKDPKISEGEFQPIRLKELDIASFAVNLGKLDITACSAACVSRGSNCVAFHRSSAGTCSIIGKTNTELWTMRAGVPPSLYFVRVKNLASNCSSAKFPYSHGASRYRFEIPERTWDQSRANCEALGGKLAELPSQAERDLIVTDGKKIAGFPKGGTSAWVGMRQKPGSPEPSGGWFWYSSGLPVTGEWLPGQPNNWGGNAHVGGLHFPEGTLYDWKEDEKASSICECSIVS